MNTHSSDGSFPHHTHHLQRAILQCLMLSYFRSSSWTSAPTTAVLFAVLAVCELVTLVLDVVRVFVYFVIFDDCILIKVYWYN